MSYWTGIGSDAPCSTAYYDSNCVYLGETCAGSCCDIVIEPSCRF